MSRYSLLGDLINQFCGDQVIGAEIGIHHAETSLYLLEHCKIKHLYCIDPYLDRDSRYNIVSQQLGEHTNATLLRMTSDKAAQIVKDELDFVFIDGDHSYKAVLSDLNIWATKIKSNGLLTGHDWCRYKIGVPVAGTEYFNKNKNMFKKIFSKDEMQKMDLKKCYTIGCSGLIHKQKHSDFPFWWVIKR